MADDAILFQKMGKALSMWIRIEEALCIIYARLVGAANPDAAMASFNAVINFNAKLNMVHGVAQKVLPAEPELAEWNRLHKKIGRRAKRRAGLAHSRAITPDILKRTGRATGNAVRLGPTPIGNITEGPTFSEKEIDDIIESFNDLSDDLLNFLLNIDCLEWFAEHQTPQSVRFS